MAAASSVNSSATPLYVPPSGSWDGIDGKWSTFWMQAGTPPQTVKLLPGTSAAAGSVPWLLNPDGCQYQSTMTLSACSNSRGGIFHWNTSSTWSTRDLLANPSGAFFNLTTFEERLLGKPGGGGSYGFETLSFGVGSSDFPKIDGAFIATIAGNDYWLGSLGISPMPIVLGDHGGPRPSLMNMLKDQGHIPSYSWAYTAGAYYKGPDALGSLTLGGYDQTRLAPDYASFKFADDPNRDLVVSLESLTYNTTSSSPLLTSSIDVFLDSMVPDLWLPIEVCTAFENAFNLTWDRNQSIYYVDDTTHTALKDQNPIFTFTLGQPGRDASSTSSVQIVLPYAAFDLNISQPVVPNDARYFPLKQAQNESQYTLGRTFFQEAYVIADYERRNFSISQAYFPFLGTERELVTIHATRTNTSQPAHLNKGKVAGLAVGCVAALILLAFVLYRYFRMHRKRRKAEIDKNRESSPAPEQNNNPDGLFVLEAERGLYGGHARQTPRSLYIENEAAVIHEADTGVRRNTEMDASTEKHGLEDRWRQVHEMLGSAEFAVEMGTPTYELASPGCELEQIRMKREAR